METLKKYSCISKCFDSCASDFDTDCVCNSFAQDSDSISKTSSCIEEHCGTDSGLAFPKFAQECSIFLNEPVTFNGTTVETVSTPAPSGTRIGLQTLTSTNVSGLTSVKVTPTIATRSFQSARPTGAGTTSIPDLGALPTISSSLHHTNIPTETSVQGGQSTEEPQVTKESSNDSHPLIAVYVLGPVTLVVILIAIFIVWRRRKTRRRSIASFTGVDGWNSSQNPIAGMRGTGDEELATGRFPPRSMNQMENRKMFPLPAFPPPVCQPSIGRWSGGVQQRVANKELPRVPQTQRPITTISEVSEISRISEGDGEAYRMMDSEDELRRAYLEVRQGFRPSSAASSAKTSMDWSVMIDESQEPGYRPGSRYSEVSIR